MSTSRIKIPEYLLKFPSSLPNDLEGFIFYYPNKFPLIVDEYVKVTERAATDPVVFREYADWARNELWLGFEKIKKDFDKGDQNDLAFLVKTDQRFHKLFCYRFWIVNYLFADGPIHDFYVDSLKSSIRKFIDVTEEVEEFEDKIISVQRDLLQSDYADLYLRQALSGVGLVKLLVENPKTQVKVEEAFKLVDDGAQKNLESLNKIWDEIVETVKADPEEIINKQVLEKLAVPLGQANMRGTMLPVYNMMTHAVEFREENEKLEKRYEEMKTKIDDIFSLAKDRLTEDEFELFEMSYNQAKNFSMYKDVMGEIDGDLLPIWFGIHRKVSEILSKENPNLTPRNSGHSAMFYWLVWYLPPELKVKVMTPDFTPFSVETV